MAFLDFYLKKGEIVDLESCDEIHFIPYDDYLINDKSPLPIIATPDNFDNIICSSGISFSKYIKYHSTGCNAILGFDLERKDVSISSKHMKKLLDLRNKLFEEGRINGRFFFGHDCCS